jgi:hypothetical protein
MKEGQLLLDYIAWWIGFIVIIFAVNICLAYWPVQTIFYIIAWVFLEMAIPRKKRDD